MPTLEFLEDFYHGYSDWEPAFLAELNKSLKPRGYELLFDVAAGLGLGPESSVLDLGCGEGKHTLELARRFNCSVHGVDALPWHIEVCRARFDEAASKDPMLTGRVRFDVARAEALPLEDESLDLIWCRDMLVHLDELERAFAECVRALRHGGRMLIYQQFGTDRLEPREAAWLWKTMGVVAATTDPSSFESAYAAAGLECVERQELGSEWMEHNEEESGAVGRQLLHPGRLLRARDRFIPQFGQHAYDLMLGDCLWHVYQMLGKLSPRVYVLRKESD